MDVSGKIIDAFPSTWLDRLESWPRRVTVDVAGYAVSVDVSREELTRVYLPVLNILRVALGDGRRIVAGLAGIPGGGKSTFVAVLARVADAVLGMGRLVAVGMDGWHWPNAVLDARTTTDEAGRPIPLRLRKGGSESFDVQGIAEAIRQLQVADSPVSLPVYDRRLHDPAPAGVTIGPGTSIVLMEGNFLLDGRPPWDVVSRILHPRLYIDSDPKVARERVIARHIRGSASAEESARKYAVNDRLNTEVVTTTIANAEYVIQLEPVANVILR